MPFFSSYCCTTNYHYSANMPNSTIPRINVNQYLSVVSSFRYDRMVAGGEGYSMLYFKFPTFFGIIAGESRKLIN